MITGMSNPKREAVVEMAHGPGWQVVKEYFETKASRERERAIKALSEDEYEQAKACSIRALAYEEVINFVESRREQYRIRN